MTTPNLNYSRIHEALDHYANTTPHHIAIVEGDRKLSYQDWERESSRIAEILCKYHVQRGDRIGLYYSNGIDAYISMMAILKAGACYVPLNPEFPKQRLSHIAAHAGLKAVIGNQSDVDFDEVATNLNSPLLLHYHNLKFKIIKGKKPCPFTSFPDGIEEDLAYIMYTSGTTGQPKGVMLMHKNIKTFLRWAIPFYKTHQEDHISNHSRLSFDLSVFDIFISLWSGATLYPITQAGDLMFPGSFIEKNKISICLFVPSVLGMMIKGNQLQQLQLSSLRHLLVCGEALNPNYAEQWLEYHPTTPLWNIYGPTEATIACTYHQVSKNDVKLEGGIPIGKAMSDTEILIWSEKEQKVCSENETGELMICGSQLGGGYWQQTDLTQQVFKPHLHRGHYGAKMYASGDLAKFDSNGILHYIGRKDQQIQWLGYRVELTEIEALIAKHEHIVEVSVVHIDSDSPRLIAAIVVAPSFEKDNLITYIKKSLPDYMIPREVITFEALPKNDNGKIDRKRIINLLTDNKH